MRKMLWRDRHPVLTGIFVVAFFFLFVGGLVYWGGVPISLLLAVLVCSFIVLCAEGFDRWHDLYKLKVSESLKALSEAGPDDVIEISKDMRWILLPALIAHVVRHPIRAISNFTGGATWGFRNGPIDTLRKYRKSGGKDF